MNTSSQAIIYWVRVEKRPFLFFSLIFLLFLPSAVAAASNRYVAPTGSNTDNDCTNPTTPCATITHAIEQANHDDTIHLTSGTYTEANIIISKKLTILGANQDETIVQAFENPINNCGFVFIVDAFTVSLGHFTVQHSNCYPAIYVAPSSDESSRWLSISKVTVRDNISEGIVSDWGGVTIDKSHIYNNVGFGVIGVEVSITDSVIENNYTGGISAYFDGTIGVYKSRISENGCGICSDYSSDMIVTDNLINGNEREGIRASGTVTIANSTIINNGSDGIWVERASINLQNSTINHNGGSGIVSGENIIATLENITITGNSDSGIYLTNSAMLTVTNSTLNNNFSNACGGGIYSYNSNLELYNVTLSGNKANTHGGGICYIPYLNEHIATLNNVTITLNVSDYNRDGYGDGGGIYTVSDVASIRLQNSILANNRDGSVPQHFDCAGLVYSNDYNLIQNVTGCTIIGETVHNLLGISPLLRRLADNGGPTQTHALSLNSPAINAGNPAMPGSGGFACELADQRGELRGSSCDIGAYEVNN